MQRLRIDQDIRPMSEFRTGIASFLKQVHDTKRPMIITQHGKGVAVLLDVKEYEVMQEKIELLQDIQTSISQLESGGGMESNDAKAMVLKRDGNYWIISSTGNICFPCRTVRMEILSPSIR